MLLNRFAVGVEEAATKEIESMNQIREGGDVHALVQGLVNSLNQQARAKPQPLMVAGMGVNLAFVLTLAWWAGSMWTRVEALEKRVQVMPQSTEVLSAKITDVSVEVTRLRETIERMEREQFTARRR